MRNYRMGVNTKEHYTSFKEMGAAWGCKPVTKKTEDAEKLKNQQEKFCARHRCSACGEPMAWVDGHWMTCVNEKCKGIKVEREDKEGNKIISYVVSCEKLDDLGAEIAAVIFS